jgi:hypothetical protein
MLPWVLGLASISTGLLLGPSLKTRFASPSPPSETEKDDAVGTRIDLPQRALFGKTIDTDGSTLLVFAGSCTTCSLNAIPPKRVEKAPFDQVILLYLASGTQLKNTFKERSPKIRMIADPEGKIVLQLGAITSPRFYIVKNHAVSAIWKDTLTWPAAWTGEDPK